MSPIPLLGSGASAPIHGFNGIYLLSYFTAILIATANGQPSNRHGQATPSQYHIEHGQDMDKNFSNLSKTDNEYMNKVYLPGDAQGLEKKLDENNPEYRTKLRASH